MERHICDFTHVQRQHLEVIVPTKEKMHKYCLQIIIFSVQEYSDMSELHCVKPLTFNSMQHSNMRTTYHRYETFRMHISSLKQLFVECMLAVMPKVGLRHILWLCLHNEYPSKYIFMGVTLEDCKLCSQLGHCSESCR